MIGVFDSGAGGLVAVSCLHELLPGEDICFYADRKNAPYGTKSAAELVTLVQRDIDILCGAGADRILIACCTACTVYHMLPKKSRALAYPIIAPAAQCAVKLTRNRKIAVISTERTKESQIFRHELEVLDPSVEIYSLACPELVTLVEGGARDSDLSRDDFHTIKDILMPLSDVGADTLILGCTHFSHIRYAIEAITGCVSVSAAHEGAKSIAALVPGDGRSQIEHSERIINPPDGKIKYIAI